MLSTLRRRLIAICVSIVVLAMIAVVGANFVTTRSHTLESLNEQMAQLSQSHSAEIAIWIQAKKLVVGSIRQAADAADPLPALKAAEQAGGFDQTYLGYPDKRAVFSQVRVRKPDYDPTVRPWYVKASQTSGAIVTSPYIGASNGKLQVTVAEAAGATGSTTAVAGGDVLIDTLVKTVVEIKPSPSSFAFLLDSKGIIIAHPDQKLTLKPVSDLSPNVSIELLTSTEKSKLSAAVQLAGRDGLLFVSKIEGTDWLLAIVLDKAEATQALSTMLTVSAVTALIVSGLAALLLAGLIARALQRLATVRDAMQEIATGDGDLTRRLDAEGVDELAQIASAFNLFVDKIAKVLMEIRGASESVKVATSEIAAGNADLSSRTEAQAGSLEETASSMEELTSTVKQNADNARQANQLSLSASSVAVKGGDVVAQVVETMGSIKGSSSKMFDIISVIDGIAFQTNILALNAAVEAARAGEQGRGFAVVASEVRNLAQRSAGAAKEIKTLIVDSVEKVDLGGKLVDDAGHTMGEIVNSIKQVADIMSEITAASQEQSSGIEEINTAITHMDEMTQQNAALVEQAAAAAESLQEQAEALSATVATFKLDHADAAMANKPRAATTAPAKPATKPAPAKFNNAPRKLNNSSANAAANSAASSSSKAKSDGDWEEF
ncbi:methyl-accepting chemotaxis protein [Undibacterium sp.]|uniref:methyl-accepting chemotaxis protein n=1 Tax=Undibacterium sp. TaxID=1914977 RepID=UPI0025D901A2|nr:methyl-accepting chemotaxis protein [Undibacterium sp.]